MFAHDAQHNEVTILRIDSSIEPVPDTFRKGIRRLPKTHILIGKPNEEEFYHLHLEPWLLPHKPDTVAVQWLTKNRSRTPSKWSAVIPYESLHDAASGYASIRLKIKFWPPFTATARKQKCNGNWPHPTPPRGDIVAAPDIVKITALTFERAVSAHKPGEVGEIHYHLSRKFLQFKHQGLAQSCRQVVVSGSWWLYAREGHNSDACIVQPLAHVRVATAQHLCVSRILPLSDLKSATITGGALFKRSWMTWIGARSPLAWIMAAINRSSRFSSTGRSSWGQEWSPDCRCHPSSIILVGSMAY